MVENINGIKVPFIPIVQEDYSGTSKIGSRENFESIFDQEVEKIKFSNHATKRLESRNIQINENTIVKLNKAVEKAEAKGSKDSLVMFNDTAFIINVPNKTVITAVAVNDTEENVFTNIDSVVFA